MTRGRNCPARGVLIAFGLASCVTVQWQKPVATFGETVTTASTALGTYYLQLNDFERRVYLDERLYDPSLAVEWKDADGGLTPLASQAFSPASIKARLDALELVSLYAQRLQELAQSEAPATAADAGTVLGRDLAGLEQTMVVLAGDPTAKSYAGPIGSIVGALTEMWVERKRDVAIQAGIEKGVPAVRRVIDLLDKDMADVVQPLRETGTRELIAERVGWYNAQRCLKATGFDYRRALLNDINEAARLHGALVAFSPTGLTQSLRQALDALVKLASSGRKPSDLEEFDVVMRAAQAQVTGSANVVQRIPARE